MIEYSPLAWLGFVSLVTLASWAGTQVSKVLHWKESACRVGLPLAFGCGVAPFLAGFAIMLPMAILQGASHGMHLAVAAVVVLASGLGAKAFQKPLAARFTETKTGVGVFMSRALLWAWLLMLGINTIFLPLLQNDPLEYATVGRILFESRNLLSYPAIHPEATSSGFYGPWTHPPLYVALIYLSYIIQGHADDPGLMRLIAPWFFVTAVYALITLGKLLSPQRGLLSGIFLISTPLLYFGANSAFIDSLPMSGMVLLLLVLVGLQEKQPRYSLSIGSVLGVVLWTHSQAILFIAMVAAVLLFREGLGRWRSGFISIAIATATALLIVGGYYVRNCYLFGSPISDNPVVFALEKLDWKSYFSYTRGLDHVCAKLQYGLLKGWFSIQAYGFVFWLGAAGFAIVLARLPPASIERILFAGSKPVKIAIELCLICLVIAVAYFLCVVLSMALGIDQIIQNERYLLAIVPIFCVGTSVTIASVWKFFSKLSCKPHTSNLRRDILYIIFGVYAFGFTCPFLVFGLNRQWHSLNLNMRAIDDKKVFMPGRSGWFDYCLKQNSIGRSVRSASLLTPRNARILSLRPADMYYGERKMVSYLDPSLVPFYESKDAVSALAVLKNLGIRYVMMPHYFLPPVYNSELISILADPRLSSLIYSDGAAQLYELADSRLISAGQVGIGPTSIPWTRTKQLRFGGDKMFALLGLGRELVKDQTSRSKFPLFHRDYSVLMSSGDQGELRWPCTDSLLEVNKGEYLLSAELEGEGHVKFWLQEFNAQGIPIERSNILTNDPIQIGDFPLRPGKSALVFKRRILFADKTKYIRVGIEHMGKSQVTIKRASLEQLVPNNAGILLDSKDES